MELEHLDTFDVKKNENSFIHPLSTQHNVDGGVGEGSELFGFPELKQPNI